GIGHRTNANSITHTEAPKHLKTMFPAPPSDHSDGSNGARNSMTSAAQLSSLPKSTCPGQVVHNLITDYMTKMHNSRLAGILNSSASHLHGTLLKWLLVQR